MKRRLAVAGKCNRIQRLAFLRKCFQPAFKGGSDFFGRRQTVVFPVLAVPSAFAINTVEIAQFAMLGQKIDPERNP